MYGLLYKEVILNKRQLIGSAIVILLLSAPLFITGGEVMDTEVFLAVSMMMFVFIFLTAGMVQQGLFEPDEMRKWQYYIASAPNGVQKQMQCKYVFALLVSVAVLTYCCIIHTASCAALNADSSLSGLSMCLVVTVQLLLRSIEYPFLVRFGSRYGSQFRSAVIAVITFAAVTYLLFGDLSIFGSYENFAAFLLKYLTDDGQPSTGVIYAMRLFPAVSLLLYYSSYKISCRLYLKGGENYDR